MVLRCELSKPAPSVEWRRGGELLKNGDKYQMRKKDLQVEMKIADLSLDDTGDYTCICGEQTTKALIIVNGEYYVHYSNLFLLLFFAKKQQKQMFLHMKMFSSHFDIPPPVVFSRTAHQVPPRTEEYSGAGGQWSDTLL